MRSEAWFRICCWNCGILSDPTLIPRLLAVKKDYGTPPDWSHLQMLLHFEQIMSLYRRPMRRAGRINDVVEFLRLRRKREAKLDELTQDWTIQDYCEVGFAILLQYDISMPT